MNALKIPGVIPSFSSNNFTSKRSRGCCLSRAAEIFPPYSSSKETVLTDVVSSKVFSALEQSFFLTTGNIVPLITVFASIFTIASFQSKLVQ